MPDFNSLSSSATSPQRSRTLPLGPRGQLPFRGMIRLERRRTVEESHYLTAKARVLKLNPTVDFRLLDYASQCDTNLICPICRCPYVDPVVLPECEHCFCQDCIKQTWTARPSFSPQDTCPTCRIPIKYGPRSSGKVLNNILDDLFVKCPKSEEGCTVEIRRSEAQDHVNLYCAYSLVECLTEHCMLPVRRKDAGLSCQHKGVGCLDCKKQLLVADLEVHWRSECPSRKVSCSLCNEEVRNNELIQHQKESCPSSEIKCPGYSLGCSFQARPTNIDSHAETCTLALLAPVVLAQKQRLDEQESAQRAMAKKLDVLETGFANMQSIFETSGDVPDLLSANESRIPLLPGRSTTSLYPIGSVSSTSQPADSFTLPLTLDRLAGPAPEAPGPRPNDLPESWTNDYNLSSAPFPSLATDGGPYASPLHHLLSMHENLRDEMTRISNALQELDGRHSMQTLNENLRTREEITYIGAQVAGLSRQVHWLTSSQLQRQQTSPRLGTSSLGGEEGQGSSSSGAASAGAGVEAAVNAVHAATNYIRGAAFGGSGSSSGSGAPHSRRGSSAEGRTKL